MINTQALNPVAFILSFLLILGSFTFVSSGVNSTLRGEGPGMSEVKKVDSRNSNTKDQKCIYNHSSKSEANSNVSSSNNMHCQKLTIESGKIACTECSDRGTEDRCSACGTTICAGTG